MASILKLIGTELACPNYTLFSKRSKEAADSLSKLSNGKALEVAVDSSVLKIVGEVEWKVKIHGADKRRSWIKIHIGVDTKTQNLVAIEITDEKTGDSTVLPRLIGKAGRGIEKVLADGAYDSADCRKYLHKRKVQECIPPPEKMER